MRVAAGIALTLALPASASASTVRISARDLGARYFEDAAVQPDGALALTFGGLRDRRGIRLGWLPPGRAHVRVLDRHASGSRLALANGRVLYERVLRRRFRTALVLRHARAGTVRTLARFGRRRRQVGTIDLDATRATWAVEPKQPGYEAPATGPAVIVLRDL